MEKENELKFKSQPSPPSPKVRIDKWMWAVRLYKTRGLAAQACGAGLVKVNGKTVKPSRTVSIDQMIQAKTGDVIRLVKVVGLTQKRVGAKLVQNYLEDHTPPEQYEKQTKQKGTHFGFREKGLGRPTKKDRRSIKQMFIEDF